MLGSIDNFELVFHLINLNQGFVTANIFRSLVICIWIQFGVEYMTSKRKLYTIAFCLFSPTLYLWSQNLNLLGTWHISLKCRSSFIIAGISFYFSVKIGEYARWLQKWLSTPVVTLTICWTLQIVWHQSSIQKPVVCNMFYNFEVLCPYSIVTVLHAM
jgi:hypothetical protein